MSWLNDSAIALVNHRRLLPQTPEERAAWLARRRQGVGASDAPVILGLSRFKSAYQLWHEKLGIGGDGRMTEAQMWGLLHEPTVAAMYEIRTGEQLFNPRDTVRHPEHPYRYANLDRVRADRIVQIKTDQTWSGWGPDGSDQIPPPYLVQVTHEMDCAGAHLCDVAALLCGNQMRIYTVPFNPVLAERIADSQHEFWAMVQRRVPPPIDWHHPTTAAFVTEIYKGVDGVAVDADRDHPAWPEVVAYKQAGKAEAEAAARKEVAKAKIALAVGDAARVRFPGGWSVTRGRQFRVNAPEDWEAGL